MDAPLGFRHSDFFNMRTSLLSTTARFSRVIVCVCYFSLPSNCNSFSTAVHPVATGVRRIATTTLCTQSRQLSPPPSLFMGGYYAEPQEDATTVNQHPRMHMMFGINCFERKLVWQSKGDDDDDDCRRTITYLEPVENNTNGHDDDQTASSNQQLAQQIVNRQFDLSNCRTIVELGASVVSLAAARIKRQDQPQPPSLHPPSSSVVAYDFDEIRLRILQYADRYLNPPSTNDAGRPRIPIETIHLQIPLLGSDDDHASPLELPDTTDLVIVTTTMNLLLDTRGINHNANQNAVATQQEQEVQMLQQLLLQATERSIPIVYTTSANPPFPSKFNGFGFYP